MTIFIKDLKDYLITYLVGVAPSVVSLILTIFIKTERMTIDEKDVKEIKEKSEENENENEENKKLMI